MIRVWQVLRHRTMNKTTTGNGVLVLVGIKNLNSTRRKTFKCLGDCFVHTFMSSKQKERERDGCEKAFSHHVPFVSFYVLLALRAVIGVHHSLRKLLIGNVYCNTER